MNSQKYPNLAIVAQNLLTIPVSSTASERTVSALNRIMSNSRTRLSDDNINRLVVLISMPPEYWDDYIGVKIRKEQ
jgi:hypothetical protein